LAIFFSIYDWLHYIQLIGGYTMSCFTHLVLCEDEVMRVQIFTECYYANNNFMASDTFVSRGWVVTKYFDIKSILI